MGSIRPGPAQYVARPDREPAFDETTIALACAYLETWFEARHRTRFCDIVVERRGHEIHFGILHARAPLLDDRGDREGETPETWSATPPGDDRSFAIYDEETGLLVVRALDFINEGIRTSFGHGFSGGADDFARTSESLVDLTGLRDIDVALGPSGGDVILRAIEVLASDGSRAFFAGAVRDVRETRQRAALHLALGDPKAGVSYVKLALDLKRGEPVLVELRAETNEVTQDRRDPETTGAVMAWLTRRGIWRAATVSSLPPRRSSLPPAV